METIKQYLCHRLPRILSGMIMAAIFVVSFALYGLPVQAVLYPALLCAVLGSGLMIWDLIRTERRRAEAEKLIGCAEELLHAELPEPRSCGEADLTRIAEALRRYCVDSAAASKTEFAERVEYYTLWAHQIKTPIASMRLHLAGEDTQLSRRLNSELTRVEQYADMVLAYLRLDGDGTDYVFTECRLDDVIRASVKRFSSEFILRKLRFSYVPSDAKVLTDPKWLGFVVEQVLSNALKYTLSGTITISYGTDGVLRVSDTGIGIAAEDLPRVFDRGYTGLNGRSDRKASGIGLFLCRRVCDRLGHKISISSTIGEGTEVSVDLNRYPLSVE